MFDARLWLSVHGAVDPSDHCQLRMPWAAFDVLQPLLKARPVVGLGQDKEQSGSSARCPDNRQRLDVQLLGSIGHAALRLDLNLRRAVGVMVCDDALPSLGKSPKLVVIGVLHGRGVVAGSGVVASPQAVVGIDENESRVLDRLSRPSNPVGAMADPSGSFR